MLEREECQDKFMLDLEYMKKKVIKLMMMGENMLDGATDMMNGKVQLVSLYKGIRL